MGHCSKRRMQAWEVGLSRPLTLHHNSGLAHRHQDAVQFARFHCCDDSLDRWDELVLLTNRDCSLAPLKLDGHCTVTHGENDGCVYRISDSAWTQRTDAVS